MKIKKMQVVEPNSIAEAKTKTLSKAYLDMLHIGLSLVAHADNDIPDNLDYYYSVNDFKDKYGLEFDSNAYRKLRKAVKDAMNTGAVITVDNGDGTESDFYPLQEVQYIEEGYKIHIVFSRKFKHLLTRLLESKGKKIYYALPDTLQMRSEYSKKMYPVLLEYVGNPMPFAADGSLHGSKFDRIDTLNNFRELLCIPKTYKISHIKAVCDVIVAEIEAYTPYHATVAYNQIAGRGRYGGKTTHICWTMCKKSPAPTPAVVYTEGREMTPAEIADYNRLVEGATQLTIEDIQPPTPAEGTIARYIMDLTGLDAQSAAIVARTAESYKRDRDYIKAAYEVAKANGADDLGKLLTHFCKAGFAKKSKTLVKQNDFNQHIQQHYDMEALEDLLVANNPKTKKAADTTDTIDAVMDIAYKSHKRLVGADAWCFGDPERAWYDDGDDYRHKIYVKYTSGITYVYIGPGDDQIIKPYN